MVGLAPFVGLRFDRARVGDLAAVTAPPYDAIDAERQAALLAASPYNVVRLELGADAGDPTGDRYEHAAETYRAWLADGVLRPDPGPRLTVYEQRLADGGTQVGLVGALGLVPWGARTVQPHERVFRGPVEDRRRLLRAVPANVSPVFVLHAPDGTVDEVVEAARRRPPEDAFRVDGVEHRVWTVDAAAEHRAVATALAPRSALMADGHHRYTTALEHHADTRDRGTGAILAFVVGEHHGPRISAMHRLVRRLPAGWEQRATACGFALQPADDDAEVPAGGALVVTRGGRQVLLPRDGPTLEALVPVSVHPTVRRLDITRIQTLLTGPLAVPDRYEELVYTPDDGWARREVAAGRADAVFLVRPVTLPQVRAAAAAGVLLPPKSTAFHPKPRTGLVLRPLVPPDGDG